MRAVQITGFGGPEVVTIGDAARPVPAAGEVLVHVAAAGVNPADWKVREGYAKDFIPFVFPTTIGGELAGTIAAVGDGVSDFAVGDAVHGMTGMIGSFAEDAVVKASNLAIKPPELSMIEAAAIPAAAFTALAVLKAGNVGPGTRILIHAAAGGVGSLTVQLARLRGAEVTALTSPENIEFVTALGATHVVDRTTNYEVQLSNFDVVLDAFGPAAQARSWKLLRRDGILISLVSPPDQDEAAAHGVRAIMTIADINGSLLPDVNKLITAGDVRITVARTYPLAEVVAAMAESQAGHVRGKLVLTL